MRGVLREGVSEVACRKTLDCGRGPQRALVGGEGHQPGVRRLLESKGVLAFCCSLTTIQTLRNMNQKHFVISNDFES